MYDLKVIDNFFEAPSLVRHYALQQRFYKRNGNYPGLRTDRISDLNPEFFHFFALKVCSLYYNTPVKYDMVATFQSIDAKYGNGWIHHDEDGQGGIAGVVYLTPDADPSCGTSLYDPIVDTISSYPQSADPFNPMVESLDKYKRDLAEFNSQFVKTATVPNKYNRFVSYDTNQHHALDGSFGNTIDTSRLTLVFFMSFKDVTTRNS